MVSIVPVYDRYVGLINVYTGPKFVGGPLPDVFDGVIVNVYAVPGVKSGNVKKVSLVVCVVVAGDDSIE
jgi:hypothetical protein